MYVMHRLTTYMWSLCNIFLHLSAAIMPFVALWADQSVVQWACPFIVSSKHFNCTISTLFFQRDDVFYLLCTRAWMVLLLRNTQRRLWHLGWYICLSVCVYEVNGITTPCLEGRHIVHVSIQQCGCPHVCLHTMGLWKTPRPLGGFGALFFLGVFTHAVHWLSLEHMGHPLLERCVAKVKYDIWPLNQLTLFQSCIHDLTQPNRNLVVLNHIAYLSMQRIALHICQVTLSQSIQHHMIQQNK